MIIRAAVMGIGVALLPACLIESELADGSLIELHPGVPSARASFYLAVPESKAASPAVRAFTDWILAAT